MKVKKIVPMMSTVDLGSEKTCIVVPASELKGATAITLSVRYDDDGKEFCESVILAGSTRIVNIMHSVLNNLQDFEVGEDVDSN